MSFFEILITIVGGLFAGILNTLAGNGSAITLSILTEVLGLPANLANGTNRLGVFAQGLTGSLTFYKHGKLNIGRSKRIIALVTIGAIVGVLVAVWVSNEQFKSVFRFLMLAMLVVILVKPKRWLQDSNPEKELSPFLSVPLFLALGFYGGFIQMGMGVFFLAVMVLVARYSIIEANAVKIFVVMLYTIFVIAIFQWKGLIDWRIGLILASGQAIGGWLAATFASRFPAADLWAYRLLVVVVVLALLNMFGVFEYVFADF
ncbi:MAG: sulfite exporter TauE/SafE family protein [Saprospiraceae bacterium]